MSSRIILTTGLVIMGLVLTTLAGVSWAMSYRSSEGAVDLPNVALLDRDNDASDVRGLALFVAK